MKIAELIANGEGPNVDFKRDLSSPDKVLKDIVAFANTAGGTVIVGVDDDRTIVGVEDPLKTEETLANLISSQIDPQLLPDMYVSTHSDKELLVVDVNHYPAPFWLRRLGRRRLTPETGTFVRLGSTSRLASPEVLAELRRQAAGKPFDEEAQVGVGLADLDQERLHTALDPVGIAINEEKLENLGILTTYQGRVVATNGAVILFAPDRLRRRLFADARVEAARFNGITRGADILDTFAGDDLTILEAVEAVEKFIVRNTRKAEPIPSGELRRAPLPEYGPKTIRELLVNAIAHADYAATGETIKVFIFDNRIELYSPGLMLPGMTIDELKRGRSKIRNRAIASVFREIRFMERFGTAWAKIQDELAQGYPEPTFDASSPVFQATLWPHPTFVSPSHESHETGEIREIGETEDGRSAGKRQRVVEARRAQILDVLREKGPLARDQLMRSAGVSRATLYRDLAALRDADKITERGDEIALTT